MSPLLFLLVAEGLSRSIKEANRLGTFFGIQLTQNLQISNLLFVDDILIFCSGSVRDFNTLDDILKIFSKSTGMNINFGKSSVTSFQLSREEEQALLALFPFNLARLEEGLHYLGFFLKPNDYRKRDWVWLLEKLEK